jgi:ABC-type multidrug transport system ATPase subunit
MAAASVGELVGSIAAVRGLPVSRIAARAARLDLDLDAVAKKPFRSLSGGMRQKVLLALALAVDASLYVLDEPTASLDARARAAFLGLYESLAPEATLILCSHRLEEIRHLVDHVVALDEGKVAFAGSPDAFLADDASAGIDLVVRAPALRRAHA